MVRLKEETMKMLECSRWNKPLSVDQRKQTALTFKMARMTGNKVVTRYSSLLGVHVWSLQHCSDQIMRIAVVDEHGRIVFTSNDLPEIVEWLRNQPDGWKLSEAELRKKAIKIWKSQICEYIDSINPDT